MSLIEILSIIFIHWVADFLFQTYNMATNKSKSNYWLFAHVWVYTMTWMVIGLWIYSANQTLLFTVITFICHFITDYITSRWTSTLYKQEKWYGFPSFFSVIGLDQFLHYVQLFLTYALIKTL